MFDHGNTVVEDFSGNNGKSAITEEGSMDLIELLQEKSTAHETLSPSSRLLFASNCTAFLIHFISSALEVVITDIQNTLLEVKLIHSLYR